MRFLASITPLLLFLAFLIPTGSLAAAMEKETTAKQALVIDVATGDVLLSKNSDQRMPTSSMSKVMTVYMVFDALKRNTISMNTKLRVSKKAWRKGGSKMFVGEGKKIKVKDLLYGVIVQSGNDATIVLAEGLAGTEEAFALSMTKKAHALGMKNSNFSNASGWPDPDHYSTAQDLTLMSKKIIQDHPEHYKIFAEKEFTYSNIKQANRNPLLYRNIGADGLKTGHTEIGGYGLIGTAVKDGRRVILVINGLKSEKDRANESVRLMEWALNDFTNVDLFKANTALTTAKIAMGTEKAVGMILKKDLSVSIPKTALKNFKVTIKYNTPLIAPIQKGEEIGTLILSAPTMNETSYPLFAGASVEELGFIQKTFAKIKYFIRGTL